NLLWGRMGPVCLIGGDNESSVGTDTGQNDFEVSFGDEVLASLHHITNRVQRMANQAGKFITVWFDEVDQWVARPGLEGGTAGIDGNASSLCPCQGEQFLHIDIFAGVRVDRLHAGYDQPISLEGL